MRLALVGILAAASPLCAQNPAAIEHHLRYGVRLVGQPDTALDLLDRMKQYHVPGVSIAIIDNYHVVFAKGYGVKEFGATKPVDSTTLFLAGSISKPVFTSGFLRLVEQRKLSLDTNVNAYLTSWHMPDTRFTAKDKVTLRRLLTHSAGLTVWGFPGYELGKPVPTVPQLLDSAGPTNTPPVRNDTFPGALWRYSGGGITIAQLVAMDVSKQPFPTFMQQMMLAPAGMKRSTYENPLPVARRGDAASGHEQIDTPVPGGFHVYPEMAAAGLWTTPSDLARWAIALAHSYRGETGGVLSSEMARQMVFKQVQQKPPFGTGFWGLGVAVGGDGDSLYFEHGGRDEGFVAEMIMWPNRGRGYVIMMNGVSGALMPEIERAIAEEYGTSRAPRMDITPATMTADKLADYSGAYSIVVGKNTITDTIRATANGLVVTANTPVGHPLPLVPVGGDVFAGMEGGGRWTFVRDSATGRVRALSVGQGRNRQELIRQ